MTDDIVTRLRKQFSNEFVVDHPHMVRVPTLYEQAADEIEDLRAELTECQRQYRKLKAEKEMLDGRASRELFECLMNRIYNASDFVRLQAPSERERKAIDTWLQLQEEKELGE